MKNGAGRALILVNQGERGATPGVSRFKYLEPMLYRRGFAGTHRPYNGHGTLEPSATRRGPLGPFDRFVKERYICHAIAKVVAFYCFEGWIPGPALQPLIGPSNAQKE